MDVKQCRRCGEEKPLEAFSVDRKQDDGRNYYCRACHKLERERRRAANAVEIDTPDWQARERVCFTCKELKKFTEFTRNAGNQNGLGSLCFSCLKNNVKRFVVRLNFARQRAKQRGIEWRLTEQEYRTLLAENRCHYCDGPLGETGVGLDRTENERYYSIENVVPCCGRCNRIKSNVFTFHEMKTLGGLIREIMAKRDHGALAA